MQDGLESSCRRQALATELMRSIPKTLQPVEPVAHEAENEKLKAIRGELDGIISTSRVLLSADEHHMLP